MSTLAVPYSFSPNTTIISGQVNSNFSSIVNFTNSYCAVLNNPNIFSAPITINSSGGLTLGSSATLTPLSVFGQSNFYNALTVGTSAAPQNATVNGPLSVSGATTLSGPNTLSGGLTQDLVGTSGFNGGVKWPFPSGTRLIFNQATVPPGWTQDTTVQNDSLLVMSNGSGGGVYAASAVSSVLRGNAGTDGTAISVAQMPGHQHSYDYNHNHETPVGENTSATGQVMGVNVWGTGGVYSGNSQSAGGSINFTSALSSMIYNQSINDNNTAGTGGGAAHSHTLSALNVNAIYNIVGVKS